MDAVLDLLVERDRVSASDAARARQLVAESGEPLPAMLAKLGLVDGRDWARMLARHLGLDFASADDFPSEPVLPELFSPRFLRKARILPLTATEDKLWLAMADPQDEYGRRAAVLAAQREVVPLVASAEDIETAFARFFEGGRSALERIVDDLGSDSGESASDDVEHLKDLAQEAPVIRFVNQLLTDALELEASDIHIEPYRDRLRVRFRVHGRLREIGAPPGRLSAAVVSRIKILAKLDIAERRLPQDGRARMSLLGRRIDMRVATIPTIHGESLVIRLLETQREGLTFTDLGLGPVVEQQLQRVLAAPHGMMLVTGPTGSGKTTTLYAGLRHLNEVNDKIISIEDPVEYQIDGVTQIQVRAEIDLTFARILRSVVRHDPNIIMVGETRDAETADISVHAALTGHLVLSTLHTNSAVGAIARLLDMGVEPYLLSSVLRGVMGQRLVGILCLSCRQPYEARPDELKLYADAGLKHPDPLILYRAEGCTACGGLGLTSRIGIFEFLEIDENIRDMIRDRASSPDLQACAIRNGMTSMFADGLRKALLGNTTLDEVRRVTEEW